MTTTLLGLTLAFALALLMAAQPAAGADAARSAAPAAAKATRWAAPPAAAAKAARSAPLAAGAPAAVVSRAKRRGAVKRCSPAGIRALGGTSRVERRVRCLINQRRARSRLPPLRYDRCLDRAAERHARDMVRRHYFAHSSRGGRGIAERVRAAGYLRRAARWRVGENLAWGAGASASAQTTVRSWLRSRPHRANVLSRGFRDVGVAVVRGAPVRRGARGRGARRAPATYVVEFGARDHGRCGAAARRRPGSLSQEDTNPGRPPVNDRRRGAPTRAPTRR
ncbi:CAP domain-containing protein [Conexibacter woesei]|uniref:SCP-like extracellular n=1 Tax=Conexibacter woesei (strain DSM 14684 / CCUG 47730 / CIP 108061 / JCM 11494 / NBRC 100937 / ID131577) TaxID=469383 RepID=D3FBQ1_CONWI|nr:CAP domain-containing protein [Conexibacter woesei]ADB51316.1 SCP-like extracellular [Conexibacter woesei DSM 14684]